MFKKLLTLVAIALPLSISAQVSKLEPVLKSYKLSNKPQYVETINKINPTENQIWWGYV